MDTGIVFSFNGVTVDLGNEMLRDRSGHPIVLRPQCLAVLRHLVRHEGNLVTKEELMSAIWPGTSVTDDSLVQCIHEIRRALNDEGHALLKTVPKRGYRLVLPPVAGAGIDAGAAPAASRIRGPRSLTSIALGVMVLNVTVATASWWLFTGPGTIDSPHDGSPTIAVLPFDNIGDDAKQRYFADGVTEDLITDLSRISGVFVIARNSVWAYKDRPVAAKEVARELGVRYVLDGSVRREGDQIRINAELIDTTGDQHLWADRYSGTLNDVFALQDKVIANIVSVLAVKLTNKDAGAAGAVETTNPQAYDALLLGLEHLHLDTEEDTLKAISLFERAVKLDPDYSRAYAAIAAAQLRIVLSNWYSTAGAGLDHAYASLHANLAKAMERPTSLSYTVAAVWALQSGHNNEALASIDKASVLAPNDPEVLVSKALVLNATGRATEAEAELRLATRLDPRFAPGTLRALSMALFHQEKYQEAIDAVERIKAQGAETTNDYITLVSSLGQLGLTDGVKKAIDGYNTLALPAGWDPMSVQEAQWYWNGDLFSYYRPYVDKLVEGLRKAGVPEGAGMDIPLDRYKALVKRGVDGEFRVEGATEITALAAGSLYDRGVPFIDVRTHVGYANGHVPRAINLSLVFNLSREQLMKVAGPNDEVVFYCHSKYCEYSALAAAKAIAWGYTRVYRLTGGFPAWKDADCPVEVAANQ
jgi:TolB-like protein/DNA-binding winged helix-turn-helix (wHTH) protein/rhodanese-related sulfurtransferase/Flp pilus assembly protein TadD